MSDYSELNKTIAQMESRFLEILNDEQEKYYHEIMHLVNKRMYILLTNSSDEDVKLARRVLIRLLEDDF